MAYITTSDLETRIGTTVAAQLTTDSGITPDTTIMAETVAAAMGEINGYLGRRYAVPIDTSAYPQVADVLKSIALDVAVYRLHTLRQPVPAGILESRDKAIEWCMRVSRAEILLPAATVPAGTTADGPASAYAFARTDKVAEDWL